MNLCLHPRADAIVLSLDEKCQIQALERTQPGLPWKKGRCGTMTADYKRHRTTTLFTAMHTHDGTVIDVCMPTHNHKDWIRFLRLDRWANSQKTKCFTQSWITTRPTKHRSQSPADQVSAVPRVFHAHQIFVAKPGGAILPRPDGEVYPARCRSVGRGTATGHAWLH
jgi:hypothetical protein